MTKTIRPKSDKLSITHVYHCILQVHSIFCKMSSCSVTAPTSFICWLLEFWVSCVCTICTIPKFNQNGNYDINEQKTSKVKLLKKEFLLGNSRFIVGCLSFKSKISFFLWYWWTKSLRVYGAVSKVESNLYAFRDVGKVCWNVVLSISIAGHPKNQLDCQIGQGNWQKPYSLWNIWLI